MTKRLYAYTLSGTFEWDDTDPDNPTRTITFSEWASEIGYDLSKASDFLYALGELGEEPTKHVMTEVPAETLKEIDDKIADLKAQKQKVLDSLI